MREQSLNFLKTLVNTPSPVGHETRGQRVWLDYAEQFADETFSDAYGNCVAVLNKGGSPRIMLAGHADEIAMAVNYIDDNGFIYVRKMGGVDAAITKAQRVVIHTRKGPVKGVVGNVAPHLMKEEKDPKPPKIHDLFIDIGVASRKEAEKLVRIGDPITLADEFDMLRSDLAVARAFDNRIGTFAVAEALRLLKESKAQAARGSLRGVQRAGGSRPAGRAADRLFAQARRGARGGCDARDGLSDRQQDRSTATSRSATARPSRTAAATIRKSSRASRRWRRRSKIPLQHEAMSSTSGTDTDVIFWTRGGIASALISLPNRYMHSPVEVVSLKDLEQIPELLAAFARLAQEGRAVQGEDLSRLAR